MYLISIQNRLESFNLVYPTTLKSDTCCIVQCPELDFPISLPFMILSQLNAERFLSEIERVLQSYEQLVLDETLEVEMINASLPSGGIGKRYLNCTWDVHLIERWL
jgi:diaminopimelate decarboxylase